jgi:hypothetical protein
VSSPVTARQGLVLNARECILVQTYSGAESIGIPLMRDHTPDVDKKRWARILDGMVSGHGLHIIIRT